MAGKRNKNLPFIMTPDTKGALDLLTDPSCRASSCVSEENEYVFAVNNGQSCHNLSGNDVLRHACDKVKLENGNVITSTSMRKYVATVSQLVDMNQSEMEWLAQHMGTMSRFTRITTDCRKAPSSLPW